MLWSALPGEWWVSLGEVWITGFQSDLLSCPSLPVLGAPTVRCPVSPTAILEANSN